MPAPSPEAVLSRAGALAEDRPSADRLVSLVLADPASPVWRDLRRNRAFIDARTGEQWDLFFAGVRRLGGKIKARRFGDVADWISNGHARALQEVQDPRTPWKYAGGTELVSFMVYGTEPDWLSLVSVPLYTSDGDQLEWSHFVEGLRQWQTDEVDPRIAPGEVLEIEGSSFLANALAWSAAAMASGVIGNAAFNLANELVKRITA